MCAMNVIDITILWTCLLVWNFRTGVSKVIYISSSPPINNENVYIGNGDVLHIKCNTTNSTFFVNMKFHFNKENNNQIYNFTENEMKINISLDMNGTRFYCKSEFNKTIEASDIIRLFVVDFPEFVETGEVKNTTVGEEVQLERTFVSNSNYSLSWSKDDQMLNQSKRISEFTESINTNTFLSILNITKVNAFDDGYYICRVCNLAGCMEESSHLFVHQDTRQNFKNVPPKSYWVMPTVYSSMAIGAIVVILITALVVQRRRKVKINRRDQVIVNENEFYVSAV